MAYRQEQNNKDIDLVIDGWESGVASSPHKGIANLQNVNISTELGEVAVSFSRTAQTPANASGTLTASVSDGATLLAAPASLYGGQWITLTGSTIVGASSGTGTVNYLVVGGGAGGGGAANAAGGAGGGGAGGVKTGTTSISTIAYAITIGGGGAGGIGANPGAAGVASSFGTLVTADGGGGGGKANGGAAANGASGGGGGGQVGTKGTGTVGEGHDGGVGSNNFAGGGGGGGSAVGVDGSGTTGGTGGAGTASSISGGSVTYGGGGGGGSSLGTKGSGGAGGGGAGGQTDQNGTSATVNTGGGGGGGSSNGGGAFNGGAGGSGTLVISYTTGQITATGGTITTSGGNTIHTFTSSGTFTVTSATLTGNYYVSYKDTNNKIKLSQYYDPLCAHAITHGTSGTASFTTIVTLGNPIAKATEKYADATTVQYRYYILDSSGYVWVYDTATYANSLSTSGIGITWALTEPTNYSSYKFTGLAILNGWLIVVGFNEMLGKPTVDLGEAFTSNHITYLVNPFPTHTNFAYVGHQGRLYYCDGNYVGSVFPDTSIITGEANVQSYCSYTSVTTTGTVTAIIDGSMPNGLSGGRMPAVFFTDQYGTVATALTAQTVFYIDNSAGTKDFSVYAAITGGSAVDITTGASGNQYFNTFFPIGSDASAGEAHATVTISQQRLNLPTFEIAQNLVEINNTVLVGCVGNVVYPWNQVDVTPSGLITLPEANVTTMVTVNQVAYIFAGYQGNIYITDGSIASLVLNIPDYVCGVPGSPATYIEATTTWGGAMYLRGRVYFSVLDQTSTKTGNCGGIWSFYPTQNLFIGQDTGLALRLENQNSYATYNGVAPLLIQNASQINSVAPLFWSAWYSDVTTPTYGIDYTNGGTDATFVSVIETDGIPVGTFLNKKTFQQLEYKLSAPLPAGATIVAKYRVNLTDAWTSCNTFNVDSSALSGYVAVNFEQIQWIQFQITITPVTSSAVTNTFIRLKELRLR